MESRPSLDPSPILKYLDLPLDYIPSPAEQPLVFLRQNLSILPPTLLSLFSAIVTPRDRAVLPHIRNRRLAYTQSDPAQLQWDRAAGHELALWAAYGGAKVNERFGRAGEDEARDEKEWAEREFMGRRGPEGQGPVGNIGKLLGGFEEERVGETAKEARRERARQRDDKENPHEQVHEGHMGEDDEEGDEEEEEEDDEDEDPENIKRTFERAIKEKFIAGLLDWADYEPDWDDRWDLETRRNQEEQWFDEDDDA